jgi:hypothetical protein
LYLSSYFFGALIDRARQHRQAHMYVTSAS